MVAFMNIYIYSSTMLPGVPGKAIFINPGTTPTTLTISKTPYGKAPSGGDPNITVEIPANGRVDIENLASSLPGEGYLNIDSNGDEPFVLLIDGTKQVPGLRETANGSFACIAPGAVNKVYVRADDEVSAQIVVQDRLGNVKSTTNSTFVAGSFNEPSVSIAKGDTVKVAFSGNGSALLVSDGEGYPFQEYTQPTPSATAQGVMNALPIYSKLFRSSAEGEWIKSNASWFVASGYNGSASTLENAVLRAGDGVMLGPVKPNGKVIGNKLAFWKNKQSKVIIGKVTKDQQAEQNAHNGYVAAAIAYADAAPSSPQTWYAFGNVEALGAETTAATVTINGDKKAYVAPGRTHTLKLSSLGEEAYQLDSNGRLVVTGDAVRFNFLDGDRVEVVPLEGDTCVGISTGEPFVAESYAADGTMLGSVTLTFVAGYERRTLSEMAIPSGARSLRTTGKVHLLNGRIQGQRVDQAQQGGLEVVVDAADTVNPIIDTEANYTLHVTATETRDNGYISMIRIDGDGDGFFASSGYDKVLTFGSDTNTRSVDDVLLYNGLFSGADITRHVEVTSAYRDPNTGAFKNETKTLEAPVHIAKVSALEHPWKTDATKSAELNAMINTNQAYLAELLSNGDEACRSPSDAWNAMFNYAKNCEDHVALLSDNGNTYSVNACSDVGTMGCIYEAAFDEALDNYFAPFLVDNGN